MASPKRQVDSSQILQTLQRRREETWNVGEGEDEKPSRCLSVPDDDISTFPKRYSHKHPKPNKFEICFCFSFFTIFLVFFWELYLVHFYTYVSSPPSPFSPIPFIISNKKPLELSHLPLGISYIKNRNPPPSLPINNPPHTKDVNQIP